MVCTGTAVMCVLHKLLFSWPRSASSLTMEMQADVGCTKKCKTLQGNQSNTTSRTVVGNCLDITETSCRCIFCRFILFCCIIICYCWLDYGIK